MKASSQGNRSYIEIQQNQQQTSKPPQKSGQPINIINQKTSTNNGPGGSQTTRSKTPILGRPKFIIKDIHQISQNEYLPTEVSQQQNGYITNPETFRNACATENEEEISQHQQDEIKIKGPRISIEQKNIPKFGSYASFQQQKNQFIQKKLIDTSSSTTNLGNLQIQQQKNKNLTIDQNPLNSSNNGIYLGSCNAPLPPSYFNNNLNSNQTQIRAPNQQINLGQAQQQKSSTSQACLTEASNNIGNINQYKSRSQSISKSTTNESLNQNNMNQEKMPQIHQSLIQQQQGQQKYIDKQQQQFIGLNNRIVNQLIENVFSKDDNENLTQDYEKLQQELNTVNQKQKILASQLFQENQKTKQLENTISQLSKLLEKKQEQENDYLSQIEDLQQNIKQLDIQNEALQKKVSESDNELDINKKKFMNVILNLAKVLQLISNKLNGFYEFSQTNAGSPEWQNLSKESQSNCLKNGGYLNNQMSQEVNYQNNQEKTQISQNIQQIPLTAKIQPIPKEVKNHRSYSLNQIDSVSNYKANLNQNKTSTPVIEMTQDNSNYNSSDTTVSSRLNQDGHNYIHFNQSQNNPPKIDNIVNSDQQCKDTNPNSVQPPLIERIYQHQLNKLQQQSSSFRHTQSQKNLQAIIKDREMNQSRNISDIKSETSQEIENIKKRIIQRKNERQQKKMSQDNSYITDKSQDKSLLLADITNANISQNMNNISHNNISNINIINNIDNSISNCQPDLEDLNNTSNNLNKSQKSQQQQENNQKLASNANIVSKQQQRNKLKDIINESLQQENKENINTMNSDRYKINQKDKLIGVNKGQMKINHQVSNLLLEDQNSNEDDHEKDDEDLEQDLNKLLAFNQQ